MGMYLMSVYLVGMHLTGMYLIGTYGLASHWHASLTEGTVDNFSSDMCEVTPHANSPSPELTPEFASLIHSVVVCQGCLEVPALPISACCYLECRQQ
jgi:hypothetical protein